MNLLISFHSIFKGEESLGWEEKVEHAGWVEGHEEEEEEEGHEKEEEGHEEDAGLDYEGVGVTCLLQDLHPHTNLGATTSFALL
jgi:hypothetical protein